MNRIKFTQFVCSLFPPIIAQKIRSKLYPRSLSIKRNVAFHRKSITGSYFKGNSMDFHCYPFLFHGYFEWRNVIIAHHFLKHQQGDLVEIGANIGTETVSFCDIVKHKGIVHAFEPLPSNLNHLNVLSSQHNNLIIYDLALSNKEGESTFILPPQTSSGIGRIEGKDSDSSEKITIRTDTLDSKMDKIKNLKFIAIDTEGHELLVLQGSKKIIEKNQPTIIIEVNEKLLSQYDHSSPVELYNYFEQLNYSMYKINRFKLTKVTKSNMATDQAADWVCVPSNLIDKVSSLNTSLLLRTIVPWYLLRPLT